MVVGRMHADEFEIDEGLVGRLVAGQFAEWGGLPLTRVVSAGTSHVMFRLGDELAVRLPRRAHAAGEVAKEQRWLPLLGPRLPVAVPEPVAMGVAAEGYPWPWSVYRWLEGR